MKEGEIVIYDAVLPIYSRMHSIKYNQTFKADETVLQFKPDKDGLSGFRFTINGDDDVRFKQQRKEFYERLGINIEPGQKQGMKLH